MDAISKCCIVMNAALEQLRDQDYTLNFLGELESDFGA